MTNEKDQAKETVEQEINSQQVPETQAEDINEQQPQEDKSCENAASLEDSLKEENAVLNDKYLRICAEYDNFRKRSKKEKDGIYDDVKAETLKKFLPVYDNLVRALSQTTADEAYYRGVEMIMTQFETTMEQLGVSKIESLGQKFDPMLHNAVMHIDDEEKGENEIVEVFQEGFIMGERVIRFAVVKVAN